MEDGRPPAADAPAFGFDPAEVGSALPPLELLALLLGGAMIA